MLGTVLVVVFAENDMYIAPAAKGIGHWEFPTRIDPRAHGTTTSWKLGTGARMQTGKEAVVQPRSRINNGPSQGVRV